MGYDTWLRAKTTHANTAQLGAFAVFLWRYGMNADARGNTYGTICSKLCAIRWYHQNHLGYDPGVNASHAILLPGIRWFTNPVLKQQPLSVVMLRHIRATIDLRQARFQLLWGGLLLAYFFLFRRSEYLHIGKKKHAYILRLGDVILLDRENRPSKPTKATMVGVKLTGAKNNQFGREEWRFHHQSGDPVLCPVRAARWIRKGARVFGTREDEAALSTGQQGGITAAEVSVVIKTAARQLGLDHRRFSTHSVRIGGATKLLNVGADRLVIKLLGRWLSNTFEDYPVLTAEGTAGLSTRMC